MGGAKNKPNAVLLKVEHARLIDQLAAMKSMTSSEVIAAALAAYLSSHGAEVATARALGKLGHQLDRLERGQTLLIETLALFVRDYLACTTPGSPPMRWSAPLARRRHGLAQEQSPGKGHGAVVLGMRLRVPHSILRNAFG